VVLTEIIKGTKTKEIATVSAMDNNTEPEFDFQGRLLSGKELLLLSWDIYKSRFVPITLSFFIPITILMFVGMMLVFSMLPAAKFGFGISPEMILFMVIWIAVTSITMAWMTMGILNLAEGAKRYVGVREAFSKAAGKIFPYCGLMILQSLAVSAAFALFIVPGIILSVEFMFGVHVLVFEKLEGMRALMKSREYVKDYWWAVVGRQAYPVLILMAVIIPLMILSGLVANGNKETFEVLEGIVNLATIPLSPLFMIYSYMIYRNLKELHSGKDVIIKNL
jgi:hypothetical protein